MAKVDLRGQLRKSIESSQPTFVPRKPAAQPQLPGNMPIPVGKPVLVKNPTESELAVMRQFGMDPNSPIPDNFHDLLDAAIAEGEADATDFSRIPPPIDPSTPPLDLPPEQNINSLPEARQRQIREVLEQTRREFSRQIETATANPKLASAVGTPDIEIVNDVPKTRPVASKNPEEPVVEPMADQEGAKISEPCNHCGWPAGRPCPEEPSDIDKTVFVAAFCGGQPFKKIYELFGGAASVELRSLSAQESDICYEQVSIDFVTGRIGDVTDQLEYLTRYKLALQLRSFNATGNSHSLPESLAAWTTELRSAGWQPESRPIETDQKTDPAELPHRTDTPVKAIADYVFSTVLPTDNMVKTLSGILAQFNQLNTRLEVNATNPNFYKPSHAGT